MKNEVLFVPEKHRLKIARDTIRMPEAMAAVMGGMTRDEAIAIVCELQEIDYEECKYPVPPVCTAYWNAQDWKRYADQNCKVPWHKHEYEKTV